ncbi:helix-turn-helix domain-containing protein [Sphingobium ummariense]
MAGGKKTTRRGHEPRHIRLYHSITGCDAWRDLTGNAIKVLIALLRFDKGGDNGELFMSVRAAAQETGLSENTAWKALVELEDHGFIAAMERGHFKRKRGPATRWRYTWQAAPGHPPTRDFEKWAGNGNKSRSQNLRGTVAKIATVSETDCATVANNGTAITETSRSPKSATVSNIATQVVSHGLSVSDGISDTLKHSPDAGGPADDSGTENIIRLKIENLLHASPAGTQTRLAEAARIPGGTLSKFLREGKSLSSAHRVRLMLSIPKFEDLAGGNGATGRKRSRQRANAGPDLS